MSRIPPTAGHPRATGWQSATSPTGKHGWQCKCTTGNLKFAGGGRGHWAIHYTLPQSFLTRWLYLGDF